MNPGVLAWLIAFAAIILFISGWKQEMIGMVSGRSFLLFAAGWMALNQVRIPFGHRIVASAALLLTIGCAVISVLSHPDLFRPIGNFLFFILVIAATAASMRQVLAAAPLFGWFRPEWDTALVLGLIIFLLVKHPVQQFAALTFGLTAGQASIVLLQEEQALLPLGGPGYWDAWWLALIVARFLAEFTALLPKWMKMAGFALRQYRK